MCPGCWAHVEPFCQHAGMVRVFAEDAVYGVDPYCWSVAYCVVDDGVIEFKGVHDAPRQCQVRAIAKSLRKQGLKLLRERKSGANPGLKLKA